MLSAFKNYLVEKALVQNKYLRYYLKWVADYCAFLGKPESTSSSPKDRERFLEHLAKSYEEWQVNQADNALRMYDFFLSSNHRGGNSKKNAGGVWTALETRTKEALRIKQRALATEKTYLGWLRGFREFLTDKDPAEIDGSDIQRFLSHLAVNRKVSASTQNQALNALVFFYRHGLSKNLGEHELKAVRAVQRLRLPVVLTAREVHTLLDALSGVHRLMAKLTYGCGLRLQECVRLRVKDVDFEQNLVIVRSGKGDSGIALPRICWKTVMTSEPSRSCLATRTCRPL